jgi:hypothetical protein
MEPLSRQARELDGRGNADAMSWEEAECGKQAGTQR